MTIELKQHHGEVQQYTECCFTCGYNVYTPWLDGCPGRRLTSEEEAEVKEDYERRAWHRYGYEHALDDLRKLEAAVASKKAEIANKAAKWGKPLVRDIINVK